MAIMAAVLALFDNLSLPEMLVVLVVALLVFGRRLPEVAVRAAAQLVKARRALTEMWRQTGIDDELRKVRRDIDAEQRRITSKIPDWRKELPEWKELEGGVRKPEGQTVAQPADALRRLAPDAASSEEPSAADNLAVAPPRNASPPSVRTTGLVTPPGVLEAPAERETADDVGPEQEARPTTEGSGS